LKLGHEARNALKYSGLGHCSATLGEAAEADCDSCFPGIEPLIPTAAAGIDKTRITLKFDKSRRGAAPDLAGWGKVGRRGNPAESH
jgi:hypothetical protein